MVYVLNMDGQPLMPTNRYGRVKHLLKSGRAKVVKCCPFTIKLMEESTNYTQKLTLGVDTGSGTIGTAVSTENGDIVYMSEVMVRFPMAIFKKQKGFVPSSRSLPIRLADFGSLIRFVTLERIILLKVECRLDMQFSWI